MRIRRVTIAVVLILLAAAAFTRCNLCLLTRKHSGHDTPPLPDGNATQAMFHGRPVDVHHFGTQGPHVLLLHEAPGFSRETIRLAQTIAGAGYRVDAPLLFGQYGESKSGSGRSIEACRSGFIHCWSGDATPLIEFARDQLLPSLDDDGKGFVVIGMCFTGNAATQMLADDTLAKAIKGVVMSQPAMPLPLTRGMMRDVGISGPQMATIAKRGIPILAFRFTNDCISPAERMTEFKRLLGEQITVFVIDSSPGNPARIPPNAHAVLTQELDVSDPKHPTQEALRRVMAFLDARLKGARP
jgi:dienelactone hydrolase